MALEIDVEYHVAYIHTQNDLAESLIEHLQLIFRPMLLKSKLSSDAW